MVAEFKKTERRSTPVDGAQVVEVCQFPGGIAGTETYIELIDTNVKRIAQALAKQP